MSNSSIQPIDRTLSVATTPGQSGPGSNDKEGVVCIPQNSIITIRLFRVIIVDGLPLCGKLSMYSTNLADWAISEKRNRKKIKKELVKKGMCK